MSLLADLYDALDTTLTATKQRARRTDALTLVGWDASRTQLTFDSLPVIGDEPWYLHCALTFGSAQRLRIVQGVDEALGLLIVDRPIPTTWDLASGQSCSLTSTPLVDMSFSFGGQRSEGHHISAALHRIDREPAGIGRVWRETARGVVSVYTNFATPNDAAGYDARYWEFLRGFEQVRSLLDAEILIGDCRRPELTRTDLMSFPRGSGAGAQWSYRAEIDVALAQEIQR